jgi:hypothetical protein
MKIRSSGGQHGTMPASQRASSSANASTNGLMLPVASSASLLMVSSLPWFAGEKLLAAATRSPATREHSRG